MSENGQYKHLRKTNDMNFIMRIEDEVKVQSEVGLRELLG
jgi:hypothetical protein